MKKFLLSSSVLIIFGLYSVRLHSRNEDAPRAIVENTPTPQAVSELSTPISIPVSSAGTPPPTLTPTLKPTGKYKDGTYIGNVADAYYGNVQVEALISGGRISDVKFLQYPNDRSTSVYINEQAMPLLTQEAIQVQSAQVDGVSGASATSQAFIESLGSALKKAI